MACDAVARLADTLGLVIRVQDVVIDTDAEAQVHKCLGSPTLLVGGQDVEPSARGRTTFGVT